MRRFLILSLNNDPTQPLGAEHSGGQTKYVLELTKNLLFHGHAVDVFTIGAAGQPEHEELVPGAFVCRFFRSNGQQYGYNLTDEEMRSLGDQMAKYVDVQDRSFDSIICCYWVSGYAALTIKLQTNCPLIVTFCQLAAFKKLGNTKLDLGNRFKREQELGRAADAIIATSPSEKSVLISEYGLPENKIHIIPRGVDISVFYP